MSVYLIDTDVLVKLDQVPGHLTLKSAMRLGCEKGTIKTVHQVFAELKRFQEQYDEWKPYKKRMCVKQDVTEIQITMGAIAEDFEFLFDQTGNKNRAPADPVLIACAKYYGYTLVTFERQNSTTRIPFVCRQQSINVKCLDPYSFMTEFMT